MTPIVDNGCEYLRSVLRDVLDALDAVDEGARHWEATGSSARTVPAVQALEMARKIGRRHAPTKNPGRACGRRVHDGTSATCNMPAGHGGACVGLSPRETPKQG